MEIQENTSSQAPTDDGGQRTSKDIVQLFRSKLTDATEASESDALDRGTFASDFLSLLGSVFGESFRETLSETEAERLDLVIDALPTLLDQALTGVDFDVEANGSSFLKMLARSSDSFLEADDGSVVGASDAEAEDAGSEDNETESSETSEGGSPSTEAENEEEGGASNETAAENEEDGGAPDETDPGNELPDVDGLNDDLRQAMVEVSESLPDGLGRFTETKIANTIGPNEYWENDGDHMQVRDGVKPSEAVEHLRENPEDYTHECASSVVAVSLMAQLDILGPEKFDEVYSDGLTLDAWDEAAIRGSELHREAEPGEFTIDGSETVNGDLEPFDPDQGDELIEGDIYYFDKAGDSDTYYQGWNVIYLGKTEDGLDRFWTQDGIEEVELVEVDGALMPEEEDGILSGYYLAASRTDPNGGYFSA